MTKERGYLTLSLVPNRYQVPALPLVLPLLHGAEPTSSEWCASPCLVPNRYQVPALPLVLPLLKCVSCLEGSGVHHLAWYLTGIRYLCWSLQGNSTSPGLCKGSGTLRALGLVPARKHAWCLKVYQRCARCRCGSTTGLERTGWSSHTPQS